MNLEIALAEIAGFLDLDAAELIAYAAQDTVGGFHWDEAARTFPAGSLWGVEGQVLYALTRALKPEHVLEFGTWEGASATHILSALEANQDGSLVSVDVWEGAGQQVPKALRSRWLMRYEEAASYLQTNAWDDWGDLAFEDCYHGEQSVFDIASALKPKLRKGAVVVHHDSEHGDDGVKVKAGLARAGVNFKSWLIEPSDCGIALWRNT